MAENSSKSLGIITQIVGAVLDIKFENGSLPEINEAINIKTGDGGNLVVEVAQHLGDDTVRCIAMGPTVLCAAWRQKLRERRLACR